MSAGKLWSSIEEEGHSPRLCSLQGQIWWTFLYLLSEEQCEPRRPFPQCISRRYLTDVGVSGRCWRRWWPWGGSYMWRAMWCALCCYCCCSVCCSMPARWASNQSQSQLDITTLSFKKKYFKVTCLSTCPGGALLRVGQTLVEVWNPRLPQLQQGPAWCQRG